MASAVLKTKTKITSGSSRCMHAEQANDALDHGMSSILEPFRHKPNRVLGVNSIACRLRHFTETGDFSMGKVFHSEIIQMGLEQDRYVGNLLVQMYGNCGALQEAHMAFTQIYDWNVYSWNILIAMYGQHGYLQVALMLFKQMPEQDVVSWNAIISACVHWGQLRKAVSLFEIMPQKNIISWNSILSGYVQHGCLVDALLVFNQMPQKNLFSWNTMLSACAQHGQLADALRLFKQMPHKDVVSWTTMVSGYAQQGKIEDALWFFDRMPEKDVVAWTAMISAYSQQGLVKEALDIFHQMPQRNVVSWNAMITGYAKAGHLKEAVKLLDQMQEESMKPDKLTFVGMLDACADQIALVRGKKVHSLIIAGRYQLDIVVATALVTMYGKFGCLEEAFRVFGYVFGFDVITQNAMITVFAQHGYGKEALHLFHEMGLGGVRPNDVTFLSTLSACSHAGLIDEGYHLFVSVALDHVIVSTVEHYNCMIDLLGRANWVDIAEDLINKMPWQPDATSWTASLGSC